MGELKPLKSFQKEEKDILRTFGVDVGNHNTKTRHVNFISGYSTSPVLNQLVNKEYLQMKSKGNSEKEYYYTINENPFNFEINKTSTESMFELTLIGIAREAIARGISLQDGESIILSVGMPPEMYNTNAINDYSEYYKKRGENIIFTYNDIPFHFNIEKVCVTAQCWGAICQYKSLVSNLNDVVLVDIGGITVDVMQLRNMKIVQVQSYDDIGMNSMLINISNRMRSETKKRYKPIDIKSVLLDKSDLDEEDKNRIKLLSYDWTRDIFSRLITDGYDFRLSSVVVLGGGFLLLNDNIKNVSEEFKFKERLEINDSKANAIGYENIATTILGINSEYLNEYWGKRDDCKDDKKKLRA